VGDDVDVVGDADAGVNQAGRDVLDDVVVGDDQGVGSLVLAGSDHGQTATILGFIAVTAATINVVGGFMITDRMLRMFKRGDTDRR